MLKFAKRASYLNLLSILCLLGLGILVYSNSFLCSFHLDDYPSIIENLAITNIHHLGAIWNFWPSRFLTYYSLALNYHFNGLNVWGYHFFNLIVHLITACLVWWLTLLTFSTPVMKESKIAPHANSISLLVAMIFVTHPIQTEAVTYIVQRATSLATLLYLASLCFYIKFRLTMNHHPEMLVMNRHPEMLVMNHHPEMLTMNRHPEMLVMNRHLEMLTMNRHPEGVSPKDLILPKDSSSFRLRMTLSGNLFYIFSIITAILSMFTKEIAITLPLMILLYETTFLKTAKPLDWKRLAPVLMTVFIIPLTILLTHSFNLHEMHRTTEDLPHISSWHYFLTQLSVIVTYIKLVIWPLNQNLDYDYRVFKSIINFQVISSAFVLIAILFWAKGLYSKYRLLSFAIIWFFLTLLPESSFLPIRDVIFEHRLYLPMVGCSIFLVSGIFYLGIRHSDPERSEGEESLSVEILRRFTPQDDKIRYFATVPIIVFAIIIAFYSFLTFQRNKIWKNEFTLWSDVIKKSPHKARGYNNRGFEYFLYGNFPKALTDLNKAIELDPQYADAYDNRGIAYAQQGLFTQAIPDFSKTIQFKPKEEKAYCNRGKTYFKLGKIELAIQDYTKAIEINPQDTQAFINRATLEDLLKARKLSSTNILGST